MYAVACLPSRAHGFPFRLDPVCVGAGVKLGLDKPGLESALQRVLALRDSVPHVVSWSHGLFNGRLRGYRSAYTRYGCICAASRRGACLQSVSETSRVRVCNKQRATQSGTVGQCPAQCVAYVEGSIFYKHMNLDAHTTELQPTAYYTARPILHD